LERLCTGGNSIASCFDLVAGTSTGGILGLGLAAGYSAIELRDLYVHRGHEIFPPFSDTSFGRLRAAVRDATQYARYIYDRDALQQLLTETLGDRLFGTACVRLCIPAFDGKHSEVFVFKTPHHRDFQTDRHERMIAVALATAAAPTYFRPLEHGGYTLVDGGVWANNPVMLAVIEALTSFDVSRDQIDVLTLGCGDEKYVVSGNQITGGGLWHWRKIMGGAMPSTVACCHESSAPASRAVLRFTARCTYVRTEASHGRLAALRARADTSSRTCGWRTWRTPRGAISKVARCAICT
jgi:patatin-like phospholipase/acyl hydrolase